MSRKFKGGNWSVVSDNWKVELVDIGEGLCGDYNENDPEDVPLLRFDMYSRKNPKSRWQEPNDSSYCTRVHAEITSKQRKEVLTLLIAEVEDLAWDWNVKKLCERLSYIQCQPLDKKASF
jgi:hypothetical protein